MIHLLWRRFLYLAFPTKWNSFKSWRAFANLRYKKEKQIDAMISPELKKQIDAILEEED